MQHRGCREGVSDVGFRGLRKYFLCPIQECCLWLCWAHTQGALQASKSGFTLLVPGLHLAGINITVLPVRSWFLISIIAPAGQAVLAEPQPAQGGQLPGKGL